MISKLFFYAVLLWLITFNLNAQETTIYNQITADQVPLLSYCELTSDKNESKQCFFKYIMEHIMMSDKVQDALKNVKKRLQLRVLITIDKEGKAVSKVAHYIDEAVAKAIQMSLDNLEVTTPAVKDGKSVDFSYTFSTQWRPN